jgi:methionine-R-sulfoxide reductase
MPSPAPLPAATNAAETVTKTDAEWRKVLTPEQYHVLREAGTERPHGKTYEEFKAQGAGTYVCGGCGAELFSSAHKFDSHCGWPSFYDPANAKNVRTREDRAFGMARVEVLWPSAAGTSATSSKAKASPRPRTRATASTAWRSSSCPSRRKRRSRERSAAFKPQRGGKAKRGSERFGVSGLLQREGAPQTAVAYCRHKLLGLLLVLLLRAVAATGEP